MSKKFLIFIAVLFLNACEYITAASLLPSSEREDDISLELVSSLGNNSGNLIALGILSKNYPFYDSEWCAKQSMFVITYSTSKKAPKDRTNLDHPEFQFLGNGGETRGRFKVRKEDIFLIREGKKILPSKIFRAQFELDSIESYNVAYSNYSKHASKYLTFNLPCTGLLTPDTKLIISKIYKDDKVIKENIEFRFIKSKENHGYSIWLE